MRVRDVLRRLIRFSLINLMDTFAVDQQDMILCRNVIIYFDKETKRRLLDKFADALVDGGYLFVGHLESLHQVTDRVSRPSIATGIRRTRCLPPRFFPDNIT